MAKSEVRKTTKLGPFLVLFSALISSCFAQLTTPSPATSVVASISEKMPLRLTFTIRNESRISASLQRESIPWMYPYSPSIDWRVRSTEGKVFDIVKPLVDPPIGSLTLKPNDAVSGQID